MKPTSFSIQLSNVVHPIRHPRRKKRSSKPSPRTRFLNRTSQNLSTVSNAHSNGFLKLSDEILLKILINLPIKSFDAWSRTCKRFAIFLDTPYNKASYFASRFLPTQAIYHALRFPKAVAKSPCMIDMMISKGCNFSRYLAQAIYKAYAIPVPNTFDGNSEDFWCRPGRLPPSLFDHIADLANQTFDKSVLLNNPELDDGTSFLTWLIYKMYGVGSLVYGFSVRGRPMPPSHLAHQTLPTIPRDSTTQHIDEQKLWLQIVTLFETFHLAPLKNDDRILGEIPNSVILEPRLIPLLANNGFIWDSLYTDQVLHRTFHATQALDHQLSGVIDSPNQLMSFLVPQLMSYCRPRKGLGWKLGPWLVAEMLTEPGIPQLNATRQFKKASNMVLQRLDRDEALELPLCVVIRDLILSVEGTRAFYEIGSQVFDPLVSYSGWDVTWMQLLCEEFEEELNSWPGVRQAMISAAFYETWHHTSPTESSAALHRVNAQIKCMSLSKEMLPNEYRDTLCDPFLCDADFVLQCAVQSHWAKSWPQSTRPSSDSVSIHQVIEQAVLKILTTQPASGAMLLDLASRFGFVQTMLIQLLSKMDLNLGEIRRHCEATKHMDRRSLMACVTAPYEIPWRCRFADDEKLAFMNGRFYQNFGDRWLGTMDLGPQVAKAPDDTAADVSILNWLLRRPDLTLSELENTFKDLLATEREAFFEKRRREAPQESDGHSISTTERQSARSPVADPYAGHMDEMRQCVNYFQLDHVVGTKTPQSILRYPLGAIPTWCAVLDVLDVGPDSWIRQCLFQLAALNDSLGDLKPAFRVRNQLKRENAKPNSDNKSSQWTPVPVSMRIFQIYDVMQKPPDQVLVWHLINNDLKFHQDELSIDPILRPNCQGSTRLSKEKAKKKKKKKESESESERQMWIQGLKELVGYAKLDQTYLQTVMSGSNSVVDVEGRDDYMAAMVKLINKLEQIERTKTRTPCGSSGIKNP